MNQQQLFKCFRRFSPYSLVLLFTLVMHAGCTKSGGGYDSPDELVLISGTVSLDGKPLSGATLSFIPATGTQGTGGYAITDDSGKFTAMHYSQAEGLESGDYNVTFSKLLMPDGKPLEQGVDAADAGAVESLPPQLSQVQPDNHKYLLTVTQSPQADVGFELKSK